MDIKKLTTGIYDHNYNYSIKLEKVEKLNGKMYANVYFTNNPDYGKSRFGLEGDGLQLFMEGYKKREISKQNILKHIKPTK